MSQVQKGKMRKSSYTMASIRRNKVAIPVFQDPRDTIALINYICDRHLAASFAELKGFVAYTYLPHSERGNRTYKLRTKLKRGRPPVFPTKRRGPGRPRKDET